MKSYISSVLLLCFLALPAHSAVINLSASMDGAQANAGVGTGSAGVGSATMTFDDVSRLFSWNITWSGLTATAAHFHGPAGPDANAGVTVPLTISGSGAEGSATITPGQATDLLAELWYINVHSSTSPGGEIRGQVNVVPIPAAAWLFFSALGGLFAVKRKRA